VVKNIGDKYLEHLGIDNSIPFIVGASDGCLANLGSSAIDPGDVSLTIGTSGAVRMVIDSPKPDAQQRLFNYILDEDLFVSGGAINNGGSLLKWYAESFLHRSFERTADFEWFVNEAEKAPPGCDGLVFLPYVQGERAPIWDAKARGVFFGVHSSHGQSHFMRALVEGICFALYQVAQSLEESIAPIKNIYASGGFIRSKTWLQILADVFNKDMLIVNASDASAAGACILGLEAIGKLQNLSTAKSFFESGTSVSPNKETHEIYMRNFRVYDGLYGRLKDEFPKLQD